MMHPYPIVIWHLLMSAEAWYMARLSCSKCPINYTNDRRWQGGYPRFPDLISVNLHGKHSCQDIRWIGWSQMGKRVDRKWDEIKKWWGHLGWCVSVCRKNNTTTTLLCGGQASQTRGRWCHPQRAICYTILESLPTHSTLSSTIFHDWLAST